MNKIKPVKMVDLLILCCCFFVSLRVEDMQYGLRIRSEAVQSQNKNTSGVLQGVSTS